MEIKKIKLTIALLSALTISSYAFYVAAQEQSTSTNNVFVDSDQDGLSDTEEKTYGTNPHNPDTDGDGYKDGAEVKAGYDPTIAAPNDKLVQTTPASAPVAAVVNPDGKNLTQEMSQKIAALSASPDADTQEVTMDQIKTMVSDSLNQKLTPDELPEVKPEDIKIKKQDYKGTDEQVAAKKKDDVANYIVAMSYIMSSNSPKPITSMDDANGVANSLTLEATTAISSRDPNSLNKLVDSEQKVVDQMKNVEVPQELVDTHIEGMRLAKYSENLKSLVAPNSDDPLSDIANFAKIQSYLSFVTGFSDDATKQLNSYGLKFDDSIKSKIQGYGMEIPAGSDILQQLSN